MSNKCPVCRTGALERKTLKQKFTYKNKIFSYDQPGEWCNACDEGVLHGSDMEATEIILHDFRAKVDGFLPTSDIRRIRKKLRLTQKQAAELFGGGHNAFSRYERGLIRPPKSTDNLLRLLDKHQQLIEEIKSFANKKVAA